MCVCVYRERHIYLYYLIYISICISSGKCLYSCSTQMGLKCSAVGVLPVAVCLNLQFILTPGTIFHCSVMLPFFCVHSVCILCLKDSCCYLLARGMLAEPHLRALPPKFFIK